jgi:F0F1-type ATP synthase epsilon subunit
MATKIQAALRAAALVGSFAIVTVMTGCASVTPEQLDAVKATAEAAQNAATAAQRTATQAQQAAQGAQSTANQALQAAQAAQACCDATNQRLDRMFEQSQKK